VNDPRVLRWVRGWAIVLIVLGCGFRLCGLERQIFWHDEVHTGLWISGTSFEELRQDLFDGEVHTRQDILAFQFPRDGKTAVDTIRGLAADDPKHPPLYFVLATWWVRLFGSSVGVLRGLSAVLGLLSLPLVYLLCRELDGDRVVGWVAVGLVAVSPLHCVYGQEARQYLLWVDLILVASWLLLLALRRTCSSGGTWLFGLYGTAMALAMYTHPFTGLVGAGHLLFVWFAQGKALTAVTRRTATALAVVAVLFLPIVAAIVGHWQDQVESVAWMASPVSVPDWLGRVVTGYARVFLDLWRPSDSVHLQYLGVLPLAVALLGVMASVRRGSSTTWAFLACVGVAGSLPLMMADIVQGGWRSAIIRYQFPTCLALQLSVAFAVALHLASRQRWRRVAGGSVAALLAVSGVVSGGLRAGSEVWWNHTYGAETLAAAARVNASQDALVITSERGWTSFGMALSLVHRLDREVRVQMVVEPDIPIIPEESRQVFVWWVSSDMRSRLADLGWTLEVIIPGKFYRLDRIGMGKSVSPKPSSPQVLKPSLTSTSPPRRPSRSPAVRPPPTPPPG
jgi:uncharacterized membrane protein